MGAKPPVSVQRQADDGPSIPFSQPVALAVQPVLSVTVSAIPGLTSTQSGPIFDFVLEPLRLLNQRSCRSTVRWYRQPEVGC